MEAGTDGTPRTLSYMPGPVTYVTPNISNGRRANLDEYIKNLLRLGPHITHGHLVKSFFNPREGDFEIDPHVMDDEYRMSQGSHQSSDPSQGASRHSSADQLQTATPQTSYSTASGYAPQGALSSGICNPPVPRAVESAAAIAASAIQHVANLHWHGHRPGLGSQNQGAL